MFNYLKDKLKKAVETFQDKVEEEVPEQESAEAIEVIPEVKEEVKPEEKKGFLSKLKDRISKKTEGEKKEETTSEEQTIQKEEAPKIIQEIQEDKKLIEKEQQTAQVIIDKDLSETKKLIEKELPPKEEPKQSTLAKEEKETPPTEEIKKSFFQLVKEKATTKKISEEKFEELFWEIEITLLENNLAVEVIEKIKTDLKTALVDKPIKKSDYNDIILLSLKQSIKEVLSLPTINLLEQIKNKKEKPFVIAFVGVNGVGKTTSIAKITHYLKQNNISVVLAAGDTWRAGSVEQLNVWAEKLNTPIIKANYGADPASIAYDAIAMAKSKHLDVVLIDTAGRQHKNINLMRELQKILTVSKADLTLLIVESIVGNDAVEQATNFGNTIPLNGSILTKSDIDEKGGAILSIAYMTKKPILFLGIGQELENLEVFNTEKIMERLGL